MEYAVYRRDVIDRAAVAMKAGRTHHLFFYPTWQQLFIVSWSEVSWSTNESGQAGGLITKVI